LEGPGDYDLRFLRFSNNKDPDIYLKYIPDPDFFKFKIEEICSDCVENCFLDIANNDYSNFYSNTCFQNKCSVYILSECGNIPGCMLVAYACVPDVCEQQDSENCGYPCVINEINKLCVSDTKCAPYDNNYCLQQKQNYCRLENDEVCVPDLILPDETGCRVKYMNDSTGCNNDPYCYWDASIPATLKCRDVIEFSLCREAVTEKQV
jgi:hypothetical protein